MGAVSMADDTTASVIPLHQVPPKKRKTGAERSKAYRQRKRQKARAAVSADTGSPSSASLIPPELSSAELPSAERLVTPPPTVMQHAAEPVTSSRYPMASVFLSIAALA